MDRKRIVAALLGIIIAVIVTAILWPGAEALVAGAALGKGKVDPQLVVTGEKAVLLAPDGSLWAWGGTDNGLPHLFGTTNRVENARQIEAGADWLKIAGGNFQFVAMKSDGTLWRWDGGFGIVSNRPRPVQVGLDSDWADVACGGGHYVALKKDGSLWTWGQNQHGQLGSGNTEPVDMPQRIGDQKWKQIAAGLGNSFALRSDGTLWAWGRYRFGNAPDDLIPQQIDEGSDWVALSSSGFGFLALKADRSLWLGGQNARFVATECANNPTAALVRIGADNDWDRILCGGIYFLARKRDGSWWGCGQNHEGSLGIGQSREVLEVLSPRQLPYDFEPWAMAVGSHNATTLVLLKDGTLWSCGSRIGAEKLTPRFVNLKARANRYLEYLPGRPFFPIRTHKADTTPVRIWTLPPEVIRACEPAP